MYQKKRIKNVPKIATAFNWLLFSTNTQTLIDTKPALKIPNNLLHSLEFATNIP